MALQDAGAGFAPQIQARARTGLWRLAGALDGQRGHLFLFVPVLLGIGIGGYFALLRDPTPPEWALMGAVALACALGLWRAPPDHAPWLAVPLLVLCGAALAGWRTQDVAAPVLERRYFGTIEGRIVRIDRSASDYLRVTLDQIALDGVAPLPARVRVALHGGPGDVVLEPGARVAMRGHLSPPPGPSEPGGFDYRRLAWFDRLGGVGYTRAPPDLLSAPDERASDLRIHRLRMSISAGVQTRLPGDTGAFAAAILTGDRSAIPSARTEELRISNLAHLLAISGLHMGLLTGFVFALVRLALAVVPYVALRVAGHKLAALAALAAGAFYLALSGGNVATERAFIMVAVMFGAVLADRRAISLRSIALAACIILTLRPEALVQAGFQMSFAATIALVAVFRALRDDSILRARIPRWAWPILSVVLCSLVAGLATAPIAAASFNRLAEYGLMANLAAVPLMGLVIMPAAVLAALLWPVGLEGIGLAIMDPAIRWVLFVAAYVSQLDGAVTPVPQPAAWVVPILCLGGLWLVIWQGRARWVGVGVMALAFAGWAQSPRPTLLIAPDGAVVGLMGPQGRMISKPRAGSFAAESWLQADGDSADQTTAQARSGTNPRAPATFLRANGLEVVHLTGKRGAQMLDDVCLTGRIVVMNENVPRADRPCLLYVPRRLWRTGAVAMEPGPDGPRITTARDLAGVRPWTGQR